MTTTWSSRIEDGGNPNRHQRTIDSDRNQSGSRSRAVGGGVDGHVIQRKPACACGGGCPRCEERPPIQAQLKVSQPDDPHEREADQIAEQVMHQSDIPAVAGRLEDRVQAKAVESSTATPSFPGTLVTTPGSGQPLDQSTRGFFESRFGQDFNHVRVHTDRSAANSAESIDAHAYTVGSNVVFGPGQYAPDTQAGRKLIAHELAHVVQQGGGNLGVQRQAKEGCAANENKHITDAVAEAHTDLGSAINLMKERPLTDQVKNAMWLAFRDDSEATADALSEKLLVLQANIKTADYSCVTSAHPDYATKCKTAYGYVTGESQDGGYAKHFGAINLCFPKFGNLGEHQKSRGVIHEASHRFLDVNDTGYFSMQDDLTLPDCTETPHPAQPFEQDEKSGTAGDAPVVRLDNADAYACFVYYLTHTTAPDLTTRAKEYRGQNLQIGVQTRGFDKEKPDIYTETGIYSQPSFNVSGVPENSGYAFRWRFVAGDMKFNLRSPKDIYTMAYDERNTEVFVGPGARSTLAGMTATEGIVTCEVQFWGPFGMYTTSPTVTLEKKVRIVKGQDPNDPSLPFRSP